MTKYMQLFACMAALSLLGTGEARAQTKDTPEPSVRVAVQPKPRIPVQVHVVISRYRDEKRISSAPYTLTVNANTLQDGGKPSSLRMGARIPVPNRAAGGPEEYQNIGTSIDCFANSLDDGRFELNITIEEVSVHMNDQAAADAPRASQLPVFRSFRSSNELILRDGQSSQFTAATDRVTGELVRVEVTLRVVK